MPETRADPVLDLFHPAVRGWFTETFEAPSPVQEAAWPVIAAGENVLGQAPTGSGKTLAAFLVAIDRLVRRAEAEGLEPGVRVLYVSPLKALSYDIQRNLLEPLEGVRARFEAEGKEPPPIRTVVRTGDTDRATRRRIVREPPHVLITTPESLYLLLTSKARRALRSVRQVIVDEIHAVAPNKRGVHLALSLERLEELAGRSPARGAAPPPPPGPHVQRIGLSATQRPLRRIARFLGGRSAGEEGELRPRPVEVVDVSSRPDLDLEVTLPDPDLGALPAGTIWPRIVRRILDLMEGRRQTLVFVNKRSQAEKLTALLNEELGEEVVRTHHGSIAREVRQAIEADLKAGRIPALVATATLELGIDVGAIDLVIQVQSPGAIGRGLQRVGRSGHVLGARSKGRLLPRDRGEVLALAALAEGMEEGAIEETRLPERCLDVLAQQVAATVAMTGEEGVGVDDLLGTFRRAWPYRDLGRREMEAVCRMLAGGYRADGFSELTPRLAWDRTGDRLRPRRSTQRHAIWNAGTIPDRGNYRVVDTEGSRLGELDEEFSNEVVVGETIVLGTALWRIVGIDRDRVVVEPGEPPATYPFWRGGGPGRTLDLGRRLGALTRRVADGLDDPDLTDRLASELPLDRPAARVLVAHVREQVEVAGACPTDRTVLLDAFRDEVGSRRLAVLSPFGYRVHAAWAIALSRRVFERTGTEIRALPADDGVLLALPDTDGPFPFALFRGLRADEVEDAVLAELEATALFAQRFRECAVRGLVLSRQRPGDRTPLWLQRLKASDLLQVTREIPDFPIMVEAYRECLTDALDIPGLRSVLEDLETGRMRWVERDAVDPSPFAGPLLFRFQGAFIEEEDAPQAERCRAFLPLHRSLLEEVLSESELRQMIDPDAVEAVAEQRSGRGEEGRPGSPDELEELLLRVGDLTPDEVAGRVGPEAEEWLARLADEGRVERIEVDDDVRWAAAPRVPDVRKALEAGDAEALRSVIRAHLRGRGPVRASDVADRYGIEEDEARVHLDGLVEEGDVRRGAYLPDGTGEEWCDRRNLQEIHRLSLESHREDAAPREPAALARYLLRRFHLEPGTTVHGPEGLGSLLERLRGMALPAETWEGDVLRPRVEGYETAWLDRTVGTGRLHWQGWGAGPGGHGIGRIVFRSRSDGLTPVEPRDDDGPGERAEETGAVEAHLAGCGASFAWEIAEGTGLEPREVREALLELCRAGRATNDRFDPVRKASEWARDARRDRPRRRGRPVEQGWGRWSRVEADREDEEDEDPEAWGRLLLERYGIASREIAKADRVPCPWRRIYRALKLLELRGEIRRGRFVEGLRGAQFAETDAIEGIRSGGGRETLREAPMLIAVCDPANPFGRFLPLLDAEGEEVTARRVASTHLLVRDGVPVVLSQGWGKRLELLRPDLATDLEATLHPLTDLLRRPRELRPVRALRVESWNGDPVRGSPAEEPLRDLGFAPDGDGLRLSPLRV